MPNVRRILPLLAVAAAMASAASLGAHDFFLRATAWEVPADTTLVLAAYNGTFSRSANAVTADRLVSLVMARNGQVMSLPPSVWAAAPDSTAHVTLESGAAGTLVVGAATAPRVLALSAGEFNAYLADDGIPDELTARRRDGTASQPSRESYAKAVKAVLRVGGRAGGGHDVVLGHEVELVPLDDPYTIRRGGILRIRALGNGQPLAKQLVLAGGRQAAGARIPVQEVRTDAEGIARIRLTHRGSWYAKTIRMERRPAGDSLTHVSRWASLTFGAR